MTQGSGMEKSNLSEVILMEHPTQTLLKLTPHPTASISRSGKVQGVNHAFRQLILDTANSDGWTFEELLRSAGFETWLAPSILEHLREHGELVGLSSERDASPWRIDAQPAPDLTSGWWILCCPETTPDSQQARLKERIVLLFSMVQREVAGLCNPSELAKRCSNLIVDLGLAQGAVMEIPTLSGEERNIRAGDTSWYDEVADRRGCIQIPLLAYDKRIGSLWIKAEPESDLLQELAELGCLLGTAFQGSQVRMELEQKQTDLYKARYDLRKLSLQLNLAEEKERKRIAGAIHDEIGHTLALCKIKSGLLRRHMQKSESAAGEEESLLGSLEEGLEHCIRSTRRLTFELSPPSLHSVGLGAALAELSERLSEDFPAEIDVYANPVDTLPSQTRILLYQSARECLINALKHADANCISLSCKVAATGDVELMVSDDGCGFLPSNVDRSRHFGLFSLEERMDWMGGSMSITSSVEKGSTIILRLPQPPDS